MYLLTVKDGLVTRYIGPYSSPKQASDDLERVLVACSDRAHWQIHSLEAPPVSFLPDRVPSRKNVVSAIAS